MKKISKQISKIFIVIFSMLLIFNVSSVNAKIDENTTANIIVTVPVAKEDKGKTITVYAHKIIEVNTVNGGPANPIFTWSNNIADWVNTNYSAYIDQSNGNAVTDTFMNLNNTTDKDIIKKFYHELESEIKKGNLTTDSQTVTSDSDMETSTVTVNFNAMNMGQYLITAKVGVNIYHPTSIAILPIYENDDWITKDANITLKYEKPSIIKNVANPTDKTVNIGDTVSYVLTPTVPNYPINALSKKFVVGDNLSKGLTLNTNSITVYTDTTKNTVMDSKLFSINKTPGITSLNSPYTFEITFTDDAIKAYAGTQICITYDALVNKDAIIIDDLKNISYIGYYNDPYEKNSYIEIPDNENVYTYGIDLKKVDSTDQTKTLAGAEFTLIKQGEQKPLTFIKRESSNDYVFDTTTTNTTLAVDNNGLLKIYGLDEGTYILKETKAPIGGYILPSGDITIKIQETDEKNGILENGEVTITAKGTSEYDDILLENNHIKLNVLNTKGGDFNLPVTGGTGTILFTLGGLMVMGSAAMVVFRNRKTKDATR